MPSFVQNITTNFGVAITLDDKSMDSTDSPYDYYLEFSQYYGGRYNCELYGDECSYDHVLWQANDMGSPYICTNHFYPQEQLGYQFLAAPAKVAA